MSDRLALLLIKPSKYDDDGYVVRFFRGVLPSNTLATLAGLTRQVIDSGELGSIDVDCHLFDEQVNRIDPHRLVRRHRRGGRRVVVALCGVQSNQFPRAADLARQFKAEGADVMIGGFHVSGALATSPTGMTPECQELLDAGVTLVKGEVEETWGAILRDAAEGRLQPLYDITTPPDLSKAELPLVDPALMRRFVYPNMGTIDAGRGCPFSCSFCTIINVQGRKMRCRSPEKIKTLLRENAKNGIRFYFFTDDNFSRNPQWERILDVMIELREQEGIDVSFMMQVDTLATRNRRFVEKAAAAGCNHVFIGMESINPENLASANKKQNHVDWFREMTDTWHAHGVSCHVGYIVGFPNDTPESVREEVRRLVHEVQVDQASFFMMTPLPGSCDHAELVRKGVPIDPDLNTYDSQHAAMPHPRMSAEEWCAAYVDAWREFYSVESMKAILSRANERTYWSLLRNFAWSKYAVFVEGLHPMLTGFFRLKGRKERRPGYAVESLPRHLWRRSRELVHWTVGLARIYFEMQEVWLATRGRARAQANLEELRRRYTEAKQRLGAQAARAGAALTERAQRAGEVLESGLAHARAGAADLIRHARSAAPPSGRPRRWNPFRIRHETRAHLDAYWRRTPDRLRRGRIWAVNPFGVAYNLARDLRLCLAFDLSLLLSIKR